MLVKPTMEKLLGKVSSRYILTILAAKRARQLVNGAQPLAESETPNHVTMACEEISAGKVVAVRGIHSATVPLRPEVEAERLREEMEKRNARYREEMEEESNARMRSLMSIANQEEEESETDEDDIEIVKSEGQDVIISDSDDDDDKLSIDDLITFLDEGSDEVSEDSK
ncbi:DNA-directed RNA polymerase subunit omega [Candidatus Nomurabacteria bacterium]|nr:DNA-directed RNA polymerase subunit omega [Candidatus Nomurabacteria bacterium]